MKKVISILCIVLLLCSAMTLAVSAAAGTPEDPVIFSGLNFNMIKIPAGETHYARFTDTSGAAKRQISINSTTDKTAGYVLTYGEATENSDANGYCNLVAAPDADGTYLLAITNNAAKQATFFVNFYDVSPYKISDIPVYEGENAVTTLMADTTLFVFEPEETAIYEVAIDNKDAALSRWDGSVFYVTGMAEQSTTNKLEVTCSAIGQTLLIGVSGVDAANITITKIDDYTPPASIEYVEYTNKHIPKKENFKLPEGELTEVDITVAHTVVLGSDGIYRYGSANGPIMYVDMTGVPFADLYECYYPSSGGDVADRMRGSYLDEEGNTCGYDFLNAMRLYADALNAEGFYYLTVDVANYLNMFGKDQGWFKPEYSPFEEIKNGEYLAESAWLITSYYAPDTAGQEPVTPDDPNTPNTPNTPSEPNEPGEPDAPIGGNGGSDTSPETGDVSAFGAVAALLLSSTGVLTLRKKNN